MIDSLYVYLGLAGFGGLIFGIGQWMLRDAMRKHPPKR